MKLNLNHIWHVLVSDIKVFLQSEVSSRLCCSEDTTYSQMLCLQCSPACMFLCMFLCVSQCADCFRANTANGRKYENNQRQATESEKEFQWYKFCEYILLYFFIRYIQIQWSCVSCFMSCLNINILAALLTTFYTHSCN